MPRMIRLIDHKAGAGAATRSDADIPAIGGHRHRVQFVVVWVSRAGLDLPLVGEAILLHLCVVGVAITALATNKGGDTTMESLVPC